MYIMSPLESLPFVITLILGIINQKFISLQSVVFILLLAIYVCTCFYFSLRSLHLLVEANLIYIQKLCKKIQNFFKNNQLPIFLIVNSALFFLLASFFEPIVCLIVHVLWLNFFFIFYICYKIKLPVLEFLVIFSVFIRFLVFGEFYKNLILFVLFFWYVLCVLDAIGIFNNIKIFFSEIQKDLVILKGHKEDEFSFFYIMERQYVFFLILFFIVPLTVSLPGLQFTHVLNSNEEEILLYIKVYSYAFICISMMINIIIVYLFNPGTGHKTVVACLSCVGGVAAVGGVCVSYTDSVWHRATSGVVEPGVHRRDVRIAQTIAFGAIVATAEGVKTVKVYREIFSNPLPVYPGTNTANTAEMQRALIQDTTPDQKDRIALMQNREVLKKPPIKPLSGGRPWF